jgi:molybdate transport system substrate-binding protein
MLTPVWFTPPTQKCPRKIRIAATAPKESHAPIVYPIAILKNSKNMNVAQSFAQFLVGSPSKAVFNKYGFIF